MENEYFVDGANLTKKEMSMVHHYYKARHGERIIIGAVLLALAAVISLGMVPIDPNDNLQSFTSVILINIAIYLIVLDTTAKEATNNLKDRIIKGTVGTETEYKWLPFSIPIISIIPVLVVSILSESIIITMGQHLALSLWTIGLSWLFTFDSNIQLEYAKNTAKLFIFDVKQTRLKLEKEEQEKLSIENQPIIPIEMKENEDLALEIEQMFNPERPKEMELIQVSANKELVLNKKGTKKSHIADLNTAYMALSKSGFNAESLKTTASLIAKFDDLNLFHTQLNECLPAIVDLYNAKLTRASFTSVDEAKEYIDEAKEIINIYIELMQKANLEVVEKLTPEENLADYRALADKIEKRFNK